MAQQAEVSVSPDPAVMDEKVQISVRNLPPDCPVTVDAFFRFNKVLYLGFGHFYADVHGAIDVSRDLCVGGSYMGHVPMGLFTSMVALPSKTAAPRFVVKGSADQLITYKISVWKGHLDQHELHRLHIPYLLFGTQPPLDGFVREQFICSTVLRRTYMAPGVTRIPLEDAEVKHEGDTVPIRGTLFLPPGPGPFPAVIDLFGGIGGCVELRAALLARHGFAALALAYFNYQDLPYKSSLDFPMTYFDRAVDWLMEHPAVDKRVGGVGIGGVSTGSQVTLLAALRNPRIKAAVCINCNFAMLTDPAIDDNIHLQPFTPDLLANGWFPNNGLLEIGANGGLRWREADGLPRLPRPPIPPGPDNPILFLYGDRDQCMPCDHLVGEVVDQLRRSGRQTPTVQVVEGQGHLIEPPFSPQCRFSMWTSVDSTNELSLSLSSLLQAWGGHPVGHEYGQEKAWQILIDFYKTHLKPSQVSSKL